MSDITIGCFLLLLSPCCSVVFGAFSAVKPSPAIFYHRRLESQWTRPKRMRSHTRRQRLSSNAAEITHTMYRQYFMLSALRGGGGNQEANEASNVIEDGGIKEGRMTAEADMDLTTSTGGDGGKDIDSDMLSNKSSALLIAPMIAYFSTFGGYYSDMLSARPILTKSVTAGIIFGLSDLTAQRIEAKSSRDGDGEVDASSKRFHSNNWARIFTAALVGLLYFGPAAHAWYEVIFRLFPSTSLMSTMYKAALGQILFGPSFTCIFFATSLLQSGNFTLYNWFHKIKRDLPGAWVAGLGYWPIVDFISYSLIPPKWIPLFINFMSFVWTIYVSLVANRRSFGGGHSGITGMYTSK